MIEQIYLKADRAGALLILEAESAMEAQIQLATMPLVKGGLTRVEVAELAPLP